YCKTYSTSSSRIVCKLRLTTHSNFIFRQRTHFPASPVALMSESKSQRIFCFLHAEHARTFREICGTRGSWLIVAFNEVAAAAMGSRISDCGGCDMSALGELPALVPAALPLFAFPVLLLLTSSKPRFMIRTSS